MLIVSHLVCCSGVAEKTRGEVGNVSSNLLDHHLPHLTAPNGLWRVKLTKEDLTEFIRTCKNKCTCKGTHTHTSRGYLTGQHLVLTMVL